MSWYFDVVPLYPSFISTEDALIHWEENFWKSYELIWKIPTYQDSLWEQTSKQKAVTSK